MKYIILWMIHICCHARHWRPQDMNTVSLIQYYGYKVETHEVQTEDGYLLRMHRIPHNRHSNTTGRPVFLQHGLNCASDILVIRSPDKDLAYILSDLGYDVWLGNSRGNPYSPGYVDAFNQTFWNFSYHEMGVYDLSAEISYILNISKYSSLSFIGHSLGGTLAFVLLTERPEYNKKINIVIGFAPSVFVSESWFLRKTSTKIITRIAPMVYRMLSRQTFFIHGKDMRTKAKIMHLFDECGDSSLKREECVTTFMNNVLTNSKQFEKESSFTSPDFCSCIEKCIMLQMEYILPVKILTKCGISIKNIIHICQNAVTNDFCEFDYGKNENLIYYGQAFPPKYNLRNITTPVALYVAPYDEVVSYESSKRLAREFKNLFRFFVVNDSKFNHRDFIFAKDAKTLVYNDVCKLLKNCIKDQNSECALSNEAREKLDIYYSKSSVLTEKLRVNEMKVNLTFSGILNALGYQSLT